MKKAGKILAAISVVCAGFLSFSLWQKLNPKPGPASGLELSRNEQVPKTEGPAGWLETMQVGQVVAAGQAESEDPPAGAVSEAQLPAQSRQAALRKFLVRSNPDLAEELGLTQQEAAEMLDVLSNGTLQAMEGSNADGKSAEEKRSAGLEAQLRLDSALIALLGDQRFKKWEVYKQGSQRRHQVELLRGDLLEGEARLSDEQARSLVAAVSAENVRLNGMPSSQNARLDAANGAIDSRATDLNDIEESHRRLIHAASAILSPSQLAAYEKRLSAEMAMRRQVNSYLQTPASR